MKQTQGRRYTAATSAFLLVLALAPLRSQATDINFDDQGLSGPSTFAATSTRPQHLDISAGGGTVSFDGGVILTKTTNLPVDQTSVYGTASFVTGLANPLTIKFTFSNPIQNFFMDLLNGNTIPINYRVSDNTGHSADFLIAPNLSSGRSLVGFAATGTEVDVTALTPGPQGLDWDFFVDNIHFNEALPPILGVPDAGATFGLLLSSLLGLNFLRRRA